LSTNTSQTTIFQTQGKNKRSSNLAKGGIAVLSPLVVANAFARRLRWAGGQAHSPAAAGKQWAMSTQKCPFPWGIWTPIQYMVYWTDITY